MASTVDFLRLRAANQWYSATASETGRAILYRCWVTEPFALDAFYIRRVLSFSPRNTILVDLVSQNPINRSISLFLNDDDQSIELLTDSMGDILPPIESVKKDELDQRFWRRRYASLSYPNNLWMWGMMNKPYKDFRKDEEILFRSSDGSIKVIGLFRTVAELMADDLNVIDFRPVQGGRIAFPLDQGRIEQEWSALRFQSAAEPSTPMDRWYRYKKKRPMLISFDNASIQPDETVLIQEMGRRDNRFEIITQSGIKIVNLSADIIDEHFSAVLVSGRPERVYRDYQAPEPSRIINAQVVSIRSRIVPIRNGFSDSAYPTAQADPDPDGDPRQITAIRVDPDPHGGEREV